MKAHDMPATDPTRPARGAGAFPRHGRGSGPETPFSHDTELALRAAIDLVNTAVEPDTLTRVEDLTALFTEWGYTGRHDRTAEELAEVRDLRGPLRTLLTSPRDEAVPQINTILADASASLRLVRHAGFEDWHIHAVQDDRPLPVRLVVETAMAMVDVVRLDEHSRIAVCDAPDCDALLVDLSRNRSRRFCSTTCGNRVAVAAYRARRR